MSRDDDLDGNGRSELLVRSPWGLGLLEYAGATLDAPMMAPNGTRFGDWNLQTGDNRFGPLGDFDGDGKAEVFVSSPWGVGVLKRSGSTMTPLMMAPNGTRFGGWNLQTGDNHFAGVGDVDGDGRTGILVISPWGIGILKLTGNTFTPLLMAPNGTRFSDWNLQTSDNRFGPAADFDGDGNAEIFVASPWGVGILKQVGNTLTPLMMAPNGTRFGDWNLQTSDNRFGPAADFDGDGKAEIFVASPWGVGILKQVGNTLTPLMMAPNGTRLGDWNLQTSDNSFGPAAD